MDWTPYDRLALFFTKGLGYALEMGNRPQTLYGLSDSPIALASWMIDHDLLSYVAPNGVKVPVAVSAFPIRAGFRQLRT